MPKTMLLILLLFSLPVWPQHFEPPDLNYEIQLHQQFVSGQGLKDQVPETGWLESYQLQQGESLWGLSKMLYGDGNYWPRVWAQNQSITNPHLIRKGHVLQFLMGSEDEAPAFRFSESGESGVELASMVATNAQIEIPPPESPSHPLIKIPGSFPEWQELYNRKGGKISIDYNKLSYIRHLPPDKIPLSAYVQETPLNSIGSFLEVEKESGLPVAMQYVYVKLKKGTAHIGERLLIVKDLGPIQRLNPQLEGPVVARFIQIFGEVELTDTASPNFTRSSDKEEYDVMRALIVHATHLTLTNYDLIPGQLEVVNMSKTGPPGPATAQVIGSFKHETSALYGTGDIVFLNKGSQDGLAVGQLLDIFIDRSIRDEYTPIRFSSVSSGLLKIAKVTGSCATAVVLSAIDSIQQGDRAQPHTTGGSGQGESIAAPQSGAAENFDNNSSQAPSDDLL